MQMACWGSLYIIYQPHVGEPRSCRSVSPHEISIQEASTALPLLQIITLEVLSGRMTSKHSDTHAHTHTCTLPCMHLEYTSDGLFSFVDLVVDGSTVGSIPFSVSVCQKCGRKKGSNERFSCSYQDGVDNIFVYLWFYQVC